MIFEIALVLTFLLLVMCIAATKCGIEGFAIATRFLRPTRNMSYDLRGEPKIPRRSFVFGNSEIGS
jgi:hypothetical protein